MLFQVYTLLLRVYLLLRAKYNYFILNIRIYFTLKGRLLLLLPHPHPYPYPYPGSMPHPYTYTQIKTTGKSVASSTTWFVCILETSLLEKLTVASFTVASFTQTRCNCSSLASNGMVKVRKRMWCYRTERVKERTVTSSDDPVIRHAYLRKQRSGNSGPKAI